MLHPNLNPPSSKGFEEAMLSPNDLATLLNVPPRWVEKHYRKIPGAVKVGRYWRFHRAVIERHLLSGKPLLAPEKIGSGKRRAEIPLSRLPESSN